MLDLLNPTALLERFGVHLAVVVAIGVGYLNWKGKVETKAVTAERVRVEVQGNKIDAAAQKKREKAERAPPSEIDAALRRYCRDC